MSVSLQDYFTLFRETSEKIRPIINRVYSEYLNDEELSEALLSRFALKRLKKGELLQKPFLLKLAYETAGGKNFSQFLDAAAALELLNISSYQSNGSFDSKYGIKDQTEHDNQFIASAITREAITYLILNSKMNEREKNLLLKAISRIIRSGYEGQYIDLNKINITNGCLDMTLEDYLELYISRCYLLSGVFCSKTCELGAFFSEADEDVIHNLRLAGAYFGTALQLLNDLADYIPPELLDNKPASIYKELCDQISDLRNGRITLPAWFALKDNQVGRGYSFDDNFEIRATQILIDGGSQSYSIGLYLYRKAKEIMKKFTDSESKKHMIISFGIMRNNRLIDILTSSNLIKNIEYPQYDELAIKTIDCLLNEKVN